MVQQSFRIVPSPRSSATSTSSNNGPLWLPESNQMNRMALAVAGLAAVVVLVAGSGMYLGWLGGYGFGGNRPALIPSPTASATAQALPTGEGGLASGQHYVDLGGYRYTFTIPATGWDSYPQTGSGQELLKNFTPVEVWMYGTIDPSQKVYREPCQWTGTDFTPGPSAADFATALAGLSGFHSTTPTDVKVGDYSGKRLVINAPGGIDITNCDLGHYQSWDGSYYEPDMAEDTSILDMGNGVRDIVITIHFPDTTSATVTEEQQILDSLTIAPTPN